MEDVKKLIRSILISSPLQLEIWKLDKDYEELNGERIPYQKHGFKSLEHLLRSIPDIVRVYGTGPHAKLEVLVSDKSAHIDKLISKQRVSIPRKKTPRRRPTTCPRQYGTSFHQQRVRPVQYYPPFGASLLGASPFAPSPFPPTPPAWDFTRNVASPPYRKSFPSPTLSFNPNTPTINTKQDDFFNQRVEIPDDVNKPKATTTLGAIPKTVKDQSTSTPYTSSFPSPTLTFNPNTPTINSKQDDFLNQRVESPDDVNKPKVTTTLGAIPKKAVKDQYVFHESSESDVYHSDHDVYISDSEDYVKHHDTHLKFPTEKKINENVPLTVQRNLKQLIGKHTEGVWCAEVPKIYWNMFNKPLDYLEYGYMSLSVMCKDLDYIFHCHRPGNGDFLLFDRSKPVPLKVVREAEDATQSDFNFTNEFDAYVQEPALLDVEHLSEKIIFNYPVDVVEFGEEIPRQFIPDAIQQYDFIDVMVGEVYDPSKFWVLLKEHADTLDGVMDEMQSFYLKNSDELKVPKTMLNVGLYCVTKYNREYHRAMIVKLLQAERKAKVYYIDYGTVSTVAADDVLFLHKNFSFLYQQAIRARLANIWPKTSYSCWPISASSRFLELVKFKDLVAHVNHIDRDKKTLEIFLVDTSTEEDVYMNDTLVAEGYARFTDTEQEAPAELVKIPIYKHIHLYPTFEELENSDFPSSTDLVRLYRCGMTSEFIFAPYYVTKNNLLSKEDKCIGPEVNSNKDDSPKDTSAQGWWKKRCIEAENAKTDERSSNNVSVDSNIEVNVEVDSTVFKNNVEGNITSEPYNKATTPTYLNSSMSILPPPGFKPLPFNPFETSNPINRVIPQPIVSTNQPINFITQLLIDPAALQHQNLYGPPDVQLSPETRKQFHIFIYKRIISRNILLLMNLTNVVKFNQTQMALLKIVEEVISQRINTLSPQEIDSIIKELLASLSEKQLIEIASNQLDLESLENYSFSNNASHDVTNIVNHGLTKSMQNVSLHDEKYPIRRHVVRTMLGSNIVHVINFVNNLFMPVTDVLQFSTRTVSVDSIRKLVVMINPNSLLVDIKVNDHQHLEKELQEYKIFQKVLHIIPIQTVPVVARALGYTGKSFNNYEEFLIKIGLESDIWFKH